MRQGRALKSLKPEKAQSDRSESILSSRQSTPSSMSSHDQSVVDKGCVCDLFQSSIFIRFNYFYKYLYMYIISKKEIRQSTFTFLLLMIVEMKSFPQRATWK